MLVTTQVLKQVVIVDKRECLSFGMLTRQKFYKQHFVTELFGRREIGLLPAGAKTNE